MIGPGNEDRHASPIPGIAPPVGNRLRIAVRRPARACFDRQGMRSQAGDLRLTCNYWRMRRLKEQGQASGRI